MLPIAFRSLKKRLKTPTEASPAAEELFYVLFYFFKRKINEILLSALFDLKLYTSCFFSLHQDIITELSNTNLILAWYT